MSPSLGRINGKIDPELHKEVKHYAIETNQSVIGIIEIALREYLKNHSIK
ncbi:MAG: CopG family transcriptional regulator [Firmicutes bacterium]|nr:CopG family transcriptional regulator [Bacillota bacterium]